MRGAGRLQKGQFKTYRRLNGERVWKCTSSISNLAFNIPAHLLFPECPHDRVCRYIHILMLPNTKHRPPHRFQSPIGAPVPLNVLGQFVAPPAMIRLGFGPVDGTAMPKASVHIDRDPRRNEDYVRSDSSNTLDLPVQAISQPA